MNEQINITTFLELLNSDTENPLLEALRKLSEVGDPEAISEAKGPATLRFLVGLVHVGWVRIKLYVVTVVVENKIKEKNRRLPQQCQVHPCLDNTWHIGGSGHWWFLLK